jgi:transglutaminase-like putative cysteine protease
VTAILSLRQTLWLTASLVLVAAPHAERLPWWLTLLAATLVGWRLYLARVRLPLPHRAILLLVVIGTTAAVYLQFGTIFGRDAGVALLVVMLALKVLEMKTVRDGMLLVFLSYFLVVTNFLYSQTIPTAVYMLVCVWVITASMIGTQYATQPRTSTHQLRTAGALLAQSVPLMLVLFVLFPRVQGPLWGMPADAQRAMSGLSDTMSPGSLSNLTLSEAVAFRAVFKSPVPELKRLYWRGPVLWEYDGRTWHAARPVYSEPRFDTTFFPVEYTVTVEPHGKTWLFALDLPGTVPRRAVATSDLQLISLIPLTTRRRYGMVSFLDYSYGRDETRESLERALHLPPGVNPRTRKLAKELRDRHGSDHAVVQAVLASFTRDGYVYTLSPPLLGEHAVDEFLFSAKSGFCEHYASAFAVLMRAAGIPARIVTGYLGGEINPIGEYLIVRQADAHAWTEIWLDGEGWVRVDPTAAVSPARIEQGINAAVLAPGALPLFMRGDFPILRELRLTWDSLANSWNQWVLGYTPETQRALLTRIGLDDATWRTLAALLLTITGVFTLVLAVFTLRRLRVRVRDPVTLAYNAFCAKLRDRGIARQPNEGPLAFAERVIGARPDLEEIVRGVTGLYVALRYAGESGPHGVARLRDLARAFTP